MIAFLACLEPYDALGRLAGSQTLFCRFNAMINRVANEVNQWIGQILDHRLIDLGFLADKRQLNFLAQLSCQVASNPWILLEQTTDGLHPCFHHGIL